MGRSKRPTSALCSTLGFSAGGAHALGIGKTEDHPFFARQTRLTFARCGIIDPVSLDDYAALAGWRGLRRAIEIGPAATIAEVTKSGLRGRGGAGFPTGIKWKTVADAPADRRYIVCNADEGDSGTFADRMIMEGDPFALIEGMAIAAIAVGAEQRLRLSAFGVSARGADIRGGARASRARPAISGADILGSGHAFDIELRIGAGAYVCGEETSLLESLEGKRGVVRAKPPLPAHKGLFARPTVVNNVLSLVAIPTILDRGGEFYASFGMGRSRGTMPLQIAGQHPLRRPVRDRLWPHAWRDRRGDRRRDRVRPAGARRAMRRPARRLFSARLFRYALRL